MSTPTPFPVPASGDTSKADENEENPAFEGQDTHYGEQEPDPADVGPTVQPPSNPSQDVWTNTDKGVSG